MVYIVINVLNFVFVNNDVFIIVSVWWILIKIIKGYEVLIMKLFNFKGNLINYWIIFIMFNLMVCKIGLILRIMIKKVINIVIKGVKIWLRIFGIFFWKKSLVFVLIILVVIVFKMDFCVLIIGIKLKVIIVFMLEFGVVIV